METKKNRNGYVREIAYQGGEGTKTKAGKKEGKNSESGMIIKYKKQVERVFKIEEYERKGRQYLCTESKRKTSFARPPYLLDAAIITWLIS